MLSVLVLAGGGSTRMGTNKAWLDLDGVPLVEHVTRRLLPIAGEVIYSANDATPFGPLLARLPVPSRVVADQYPGAGPLAGLHAGLSASRFEWMFAVATDMPFVSLPLVEWMAERPGECDAVVPLTPVAGGEPQPEPLHALYRKSCLPAIEGALKNGKRRVVSFFPAVNVCMPPPDEIERLDPGFLSFRNANTRDEWAEVRALLLDREDRSR